MDLDPDTGEYRFSATVPGVEVNALRETLGVRPLPFPLSGAIRGTLHCTGPLEEPAFSGVTTHMSLWVGAFKECYWLLLLAVTCLIPWHQHAG